MSDKVISAGKTAPEFRLASSVDKEIALSDFKGKRVVLFFYPRADTPGCTREACGFNDAMTDYTKAGAVVLGISPDPVADVKKFAEKFHLGYPLLADTDHSIAEAYGVWQQKQMMGKTFMGVVRTTFLIGKNGKIERVFEKVKPDGHEAEVLKALVL